MSDFVTKSPFPNKMIIQAVKRSYKIYTGGAMTDIKQLLDKIHLTYVKNERIALDEKQHKMDRYEAALSNRIILRHLEELAK